MSSQAPQNRDFRSAKNVEPLNEHNTQSQDAAGQPSFSGPGANTSAASTTKPHGNKMLNKLDPRFDSDMLEEQEQQQQAREKGEGPVE
ncbi:uncharacterized protein BO97DRAFT_44065 [Aspergillus homomorphus CBS 101889]|uniref:Uncharacterized protein n=1 Tax=Aspergillus homomorphus (strain CBS 101889) TaxID=1450537 RepID=A0A395HYW7_ASPHC|nr:hypothetical protein BO97DRAFT_44065 [Aspergillus homomorphus CBS 101889]RAL13121.1 hypothetical protein BO97DRAFT_44065 [Aspergillus homomorphus CBS 101889]